MIKKFRYRARTKEGCLKKGIITSHAISGAAAYLRQRDYWIVDITPVSEEKSEFNIFSPKATTKDLAIFSRHFASLINSGITVLKSLETISRQSENKKFKCVLELVMSDLKEGTSLSEALTAYPRFFPKVFTSMIAAGETGGGLGEVLERLSLHYEKLYDLKERVKSALAYPLLVIVMALLSMVLMMTMIIPVFDNILRDANTALPWFTLFIIETNEFILQYFYHITIVLSIVCFAVFAWVKTLKGKEIMDFVIIRVPIWGELWHKMILTRFCRTLSTMIHSGVPILTAMAIVKETAGNTAVKRAIEQAVQCIKEGESIAAPLRKSMFFPPITTHMIAIGEETGTLDELLEKLAVIIDREIEAKVSRMSSLLEPLLVLLVGGIVGFIIISVLWPVYQAIGAFE